MLLQMTVLITVISYGLFMKFVKRYQVDTWETLPVNNLKTYGEYPLQIQYKNMYLTVFHFVNMFNVTMVVMEAVGVTSMIASGCHVIHG